MKPSFIFAFLVLLLITSLSSTLALASCSEVMCYSVLAGLQKYDCRKAMDQREQLETTRKNIFLAICEGARRIGDCSNTDDKYPLHKAICLAFTESLGENPKCNSFQTGLERNMCEAFGKGTRLRDCSGYEISRDYLGVCEGAREFNEPRSPSNTSIHQARNAGAGFTHVKTIDEIEWHLDEHFRKISTFSQPFKVGIVVNPMEGRGDYIAAGNVAEIIAKRFSNAKIVILVVKQTEHLEFLRNKIKPLNITVEKYPHIPNQFLPLDLILQVATPFKTRLDLLRDLHSPSAPFLEFREYGQVIAGNGYSNPEEKYFVTGFRPAGIGLYIENQLIDFFSRGKPSPEEKAKELEDLNPSLKKILIGVNSPLEYIKKNQLYLGYGRDKKWVDVQNFVLLALTQRSQHKFEDILLVNRGHFMSINSFESLKFLAVAHSVSIENYDLDRGIIEKFGENGNKKLRIIQIQGLEHADMLRMFKVSAPITLVNGDFAFSEAISAGKIPFIYTITPKKIFMQDLIDYSKSLGLHHLSEFFNQSRNLMGTDVNEEVNLDKVTAMARGLMDGTLQGEAEILKSKILQTQNFNQRLEGKLQRSLYTKNSRELYKLEEELFMLYQHLDGPTQDRETTLYAIQNLLHKFK